MEFDGRVAAPDLIGEILYRVTLLMGLLYALDYALDGELDLPHRKLKWEQLKIVKWAQNSGGKSNSENKRRNECDKQTE